MGWHTHIDRHPAWKVLHQPSRQTTHGFFELDRQQDLQWKAANCHSMTFDGGCSEHFVIETAAFSAGEVQKRKLEGGR